MQVEFNVINIDSDTFTNNVFSYVFNDVNYSLIEYRILVHTGSLLFDGILIDDKKRYYSQDIIANFPTIQANPTIRIDKVSKNIFAQLIIVKTRNLKQVLKEAQPVLEPVLTK